METRSVTFYIGSLREHSFLDYSTPFAHLKHHFPEINDNIRYFQLFNLDDVSIKPGR